MSQAIAGYDDPGLSYAEAPAIPEAERPGYIKRSIFMPVPFLIPVALCGISWISGGVSTLTDAGFLTMALLCVGFIINELVRFPRRFGIGGLVVFGGTLVWYGHDYFANWFLSDFRQTRLPVPPATVAKAATFTTLFIFSAVTGLLILKGRWLEKLIVKVPEPPARGVFLVLAVLMFCVGLLPYFIFTNDPFYVAIYKELMAMRTASGASWTTGRTGNLNYSWGGYIVHLLQIGQLGAILAAAYAILMRPNPFAQLVCWSMYTFEVLLAFGSGSRGEIVFIGMPVAFLLFTKYQAIFRRFNLRSYFYAGGIFLIFLFLVQFQGSFRTYDVERRDLSEVELFKSQGNNMFTEGLLAYQLVPNTIPHPGVNFPGAQFVRPLPDTAVRFAIGWIPRALWTDKPGFSEFAKSYNLMVSGGTAENTIGATICTSVAGGSYIGYGPSGVIQIGLLFGWLCGVFERALVRSDGKLMAMLFSMALATWMFRCFRDLTPHDLYPLLIGVTAYIVFCLPMRLVGQEN
jgi:hypothetical protein